MTEDAPAGPLGELDPDTRAYLLENHPDAAGLAARSERSLLLQVVARCMRTLGELETAKAAGHAWLSVEEFAAVAGKAPFTVRQWCLHGRVAAQKQRGGRGAHQAWTISREELLRYQKEGLLPRKA